MSASLETLLRRAQDGDKDAREQLVVENTGLVWSIARRFLAVALTRTISISWDAWGF